MAFTAGLHDTNCGDEREQKAMDILVNIDPDFNTTNWLGLEDI
jgi:hypothetical protein